ncbi:MAG TPA: hypothetical protein PK048_03825 [Candidatus Absconditabacterales bacterium]|nr:hypothetical protein [Candidatus Absconditabacterales bacterium]
MNRIVPIHEVFNRYPHNLGGTGGGKYQFSRRGVFQALQEDNIKENKELRDKIETFLTPENIVEIDLTDHLTHQRYRNNQPEVCVDCRRHNGDCPCLNSVGGRVAQHLNMTIGCVRACGTNLPGSTIRRIINHEEYGNLIRAYSNEYYELMGGGYCHDGDTTSGGYADQNTQQGYQNINHIKCGGIQLILDKTPLDGTLGDDFKTTDQDVGLLKSMVQQSYERGKLEVLQGGYNPDGFILFTNESIEQGGKTIIKTVKNNTFQGVSFFTADQAGTDVIMHHELIHFIDFLRSKNNTNLNLAIKTIVILHNKNYSTEDFMRRSYLEICRQKTAKQVKRHFMTVAKNLGPVQQLVKDKPYSLISTSL